MKFLMIISLFVLVSCNGSEVGGKDIEVAPSSNNPITLEYNSNGYYENTGKSLDLMGTFDEDRGFIIPQYLDLLQDSANSVVMNDTARLQFVYVACDYKWNGTRFAFHQCADILSVPTHGAYATSLQYGDVLYLSDVREPQNASMNGKIQMGVVRNPAGNHTGIIRIQATLE